MSPWLLLLVGVIYILVAIQYFRNLQPGMALAFAGYAIAQLGFIMELR